MDILRAFAQGMLQLRDVLDEVGALTAAFITDPSLRDDLTLELWQEVGEPEMQQLRPLPAHVGSLDVPAFQGGPNLVELLEAQPVNESTRRARALEDHAALMEALDEARSRATLSPQEARMWDLTRNERCSMGEIARRTCWSDGHVHMVRNRMKKKLLAAAVAIRA
jgi:hypothetical protein